MHRDVFGYMMKNSLFLHPQFPLQNQYVREVISNTCHSVSLQYQKPQSSSKTLRYVICDETLSLVFDTLLLKLINNSSRENKENHYRGRGLDM